MTIVRTPEGYVDIEPSIESLQSAYVAGNTITTSGPNGPLTVTGTEDVSLGGDDILCTAGGVFNLTTFGTCTIAAGAAFSVTCTSALLDSSGPLTMEGLSVTITGDDANVTLRTLTTASPGDVSLQPGGGSGLGVNAGNLTVIGSTGGTGAGAGAGGNGSDLQISLGDGGAGGGTSGPGGTGGSVQVTAGAGANATAGNSNGGNGGSYGFTAGAGGTPTGTGTPGDGGGYSFTAGNSAGDGGGFDVTCGATSSTGLGNGGAVILRAGPQNGVGSGGNAGSVAIFGGNVTDIGATGNAGDILLTPGTNNGAGLDGRVLVTGFMNLTGGVEFTAAVAGNWVAPPPATLRDAVNRMAALLFANFGAIP